MTWQFAWRAAASLASRPPARPLSLVTITPIPKRRMAARFSSSEKGPRPAMIRSSGDARRPAGGQRFRGVEDADGERDAGPAGRLRVGGEVPGARRQQDRAAVGEGQFRGLGVVGGETDRVFSEVYRASGRRKTRQGIPRRCAAFCAAAWAATA